jgi:hypothetical protein
MNLFDRFISKYSLLINDRYCQLIALSCYNLAKKLRTNTSINNENEHTSLILLSENYTDEEIFVRHLEKKKKQNFKSCFRIPNNLLLLH